MNKYQVLVLVESKVRPDKVDDVKARARTHHAVASVYPVQATSEVGSHGGELILCEASLPIEPIDPDVLSAVVDQTGEDLRCVGSILPQTQRCVLPLDWRVLLGWRKLVCLKLGDCSPACQLVRVHKMPFIIFADWSMTPEMVSDSGLLRLLSGAFLVPRGVPTCAGSGRVIQFLVVSPDLVHILPLLVHDPLAPWASHAALSLQVPLRPCALFKRVIKVPRPLPVRPLTLGGAPSRPTRRKRTGSLRS